jgi:hypothetical protein
MSTEISELQNPSKEVRTEKGKADHTRGVVFEPRVDTRKPAAASAKRRGR